MAGISKRVGWEITKRIAAPFIVFVSVVGAYTFYQLTLADDLPGQRQAQIKRYAVTLFIVIIAFGLQRIVGAVSGWYKENIASKTLTRLDDDLIPLVRRTIKVIVWVIAFLVILPLYGINISALITTLGVGSLAIALAAQDTIANIISGFMIMIDKPFRLGDRIKLPSGEMVEVLDIGIRRSKFLSEDKAIIIVPNLDLSKSKIINYTYGQERSDKL
jgi:small-conductance mechanosensitive channel